MEKEMLEIWKMYDHRLKKSLSVQKQLETDISKIKAQSLLGTMRPVKIFTILTGLLWVGAGGYAVIWLLLNTFPAFPDFFLISAGLQVLLTALALGIYLYQYVLIRQTDIFEPVLVTQEKISRLKSSTLLVTRVLFLQLPLWTTFYLNTDKLSDPFYLLVNGTVTIAFTAVSLWLFFNIRYQNRSKKWFRLMFSGREWDPLFKASEILTHIQEVKGS